MNIYDYIKSKYLRLSKGQRRVAQFILEQPSTITTNIASEVGRLAGVSESTVIRFCYAIDLSGYGELQEKLREYLTLQNAISSPKVEKKATSDEVKSAMIEHAKQISEAIQKMDSKQLAAALQLMSAAKKVYIFSFGETLPLGQTLKEDFEDATIVSDENQISTVALNSNKEDLFVVFSNPKYDVNIDHALYVSEKNGCKSIFIHDQKNHTFKKRCTVNLFLGQENMMNSFGAFSLIVGLKDSLKQQRSGQIDLIYA